MGRPSRLPFCEPSGTMQLTLHRPPVGLTKRPAKSFPAWEAFKFLDEPSKSPMSRKALWQPSFHRGARSNIKPTACHVWGTDFSNAPWSPRAVAAWSLHCNQSPTLQLSAWQTWPRLSMLLDCKEASQDYSMAFWPRFQRVSTSVPIPRFPPDSLFDYVLLSCPRVSQCKNL